MLVRGYNVGIKGCRANDKGIVRERIAITAAAKKERAAHSTFLDGIAPPPGSLATKTNLNYSI